MSLVTNDYIYGVSNYIVDPVLGRGTHQTIASALTSSSSRDTVYIRPGTYTENLTFKAGVSITGLPGSSNIGNVTIIGKMDGSSGTSTVANIRFQTNSNVIYDITGTTLIQTTFNNCWFDLSNGDGININNVNANPRFEYCQFRQTGSNLDLYNITSCGSITFYYCDMTNSGAVVGTSNITSGTVRIRYCRFQPHKFSTTSTGIIDGEYSSFIANTDNQTVITTAGTGSTNDFRNCRFESGTAVAISAGSGTTISISNASVRSTNTNPVSGLGTLIYDSINFISSGNGVNTSTVNSIPSTRINQLLPSPILSDKAYYFKASDFDALETNFATLNQDNGSNAKILVRSFDDSTEEYVNFSLSVPSNIDTSATVTFRVWMYAQTAAASKNVALTFDHRPIDNSESWDQTYTSEDSGDIAIDATQDDVTEATWTETVTNLSWATNDIVLCRLSRPNASANDLTGDLHIIGFQVEIPRSS